VAEYVGKCRISIHPEESRNHHLLLSNFTTTTFPDPFLWIYLLPQLLFKVEQS
jgi:hypothetical protein